MAVVFIDLDGTLTRGAGSSERNFILYLLKQRRLGLRQFAAFIASLPRYIKRFGRHVWKKNKAYLAGVEQSNVEALAETFIAEQLWPALRPSMLERLERHRGEGDRLVLLTGAPEFIAAPLARRLNIPHCVATVCARDGERYTAAAPVVHPFGAEKLRLAVALCRNLGEDLSTATAYGDSIFDLVLLDAVAHPVAVQPDAQLARIAAARRWEIIDR